MPRWTADDLVHYLRLKAPANTKSKSPEEHESDLHNRIIRFCKDHRWIYFHSSMAHRTRSVIGTPDFVILADNGRVYFIEAKTRLGKLTPEQQALAVAAKMLGHEIAVVRSMEQFISLVGS